MSRQPAPSHPSHAALAAPTRPLPAQRAVARALATSYQSALQPATANADARRRPASRPLKRLFIREREAAESEAITPGRRCSRPQPRPTEQNSSCHRHAARTAEEPRTASRSAPIPPAVTQRHQELIVDGAVEGRPAEGGENRYRGEEAAGSAACASEGIARRTARRQNGRNATPFLAQAARRATWLLSPKGAPPHRCHPQRCRRSVQRVRL